MKSKYFISSLLAAHAQTGVEGFRQKEVRFYMDLFSNWVFVKLNSEPFPLHNTQIMRSLETMVRLGLVKKMGRKNPPRYKLTRAGFIQMIEDLVTLPLTDTYSEFFFVYLFIVNFKSGILKSIGQGSARIPKSNYIDVEFLLDEKKYLGRQLELVNHEIRQLKEKISDSHRAIDLAVHLKTTGVDVLKILKKVERSHPYELNSRKRVTQTLKEIPESLRLREITLANQNRLHLFWKPKLQHLESFGKTLKELSYVKPVADS
jgi:hypothetical protein